MTNCSSPAAICVWGSVTGHRSRRRSQRGASAIGGGRCDDVCVIELRTARLLLRAWTRDDADFLYDMDSRWEVRQYIGVSPAVMTDRSEALASIERRRALDHPVHGIWAIELLGEGALVGNLLLKPIPLSSGESSTSPEVVCPGPATPRDRSHAVRRSARAGSTGPGPGRHRPGSGSRTVLEPQSVPAQPGRES